MDLEKIKELLEMQIVIDGVAFPIEAVSIPQENIIIRRGN